jgi:hypothetical protein
VVRCSPRTVPSCVHVVHEACFECAEYRGGRVLNPCIQTHSEGRAKRSGSGRAQLGQYGCRSTVDRPCCFSIIATHSVEYASTRLSQSTGGHGVHRRPADQRFEPYGGLAQLLARVFLTKHYAAREGERERIRPSPGSGRRKH